MLCTRLTARLLLSLAMAAGGTIVLCPAAAFCSSHASSPCFPRLLCTLHPTAQRTNQTLNPASFPSSPPPLALRSCSSDASATPPRSVIISRNQQMFGLPVMLAPSVILPKLSASADVPLQKMVQPRAGTPAGTPLAGSPGCKGCCWAGSCASRVALPGHVGVPDQGHHVGHEHLRYHSVPHMRVPGQAMAAKNAPWRAPPPSLLACIPHPCLPAASHQTNPAAPGPPPPRASPAAAAARSGS
jgi:hypothetical protein